VLLLPSLPLTQNQIQSAIDDIERLTKLSAPLFAREDPSVSHEQRLEMYSDFILSDEELQQLIAEAGEGNAFARSMLDLLAAVRLSNSSAPLDKWIWSIVREQLKPKRRKARPKSSPWRDSFISYAVSRVLERHKGLKATKGGLSKTEVSACSIVSEGLSRAANPIGEQRVYEIWSKQQRCD
jgi:hypothetical protein